ncbi:MAG: hypothetical protein Kilf2KO_02740 [Rhodospirillales bacterium]
MAQDEQSGSVERRDSLIYEMVLANMRDGVVTFDLQGRIVTFNDAAGAILGLKPAEVLGLTFAEVFLGEAQLEDFNEVVLKAIYDAEVTHSRDVIVWQTETRRLDLHVSSSFLHKQGAEGDERYGVIVVFSDVTEQRKRRKLKRLFGEYVDPRIVERILARDAELEGGQEARMTVLFSDMRDFTGWSERLSPPSLIALLNRFLAAMTAPISAEAGITDKFIGDAIMAFWGPPFTEPDQQAAACCRAVLEQRRCLADLRAELAGEDFPGGERLDLASGVATGLVIAGEVGTEQARGFTVIGDRVNVAARLQAAAKRYGETIVVCEETRRLAGEGFCFLELDFAALKGRERPERIFALLGSAEERDDRQAARLATYSAALADYREAAFPAVQARLAPWLAERPDDRAARLLHNRAARLQQDPPPPGWDGVFRLDD